MLAHDGKQRWVGLAPVAWVCVLSALFMAGFANASPLEPVQRRTDAEADIPPPAVDGGQPPTDADPAKVREPKKKRTRARRRGCQRGASPSYRKMTRRWRAPVRVAGPRYRDGYRDLVLYSVNLGERIRVFPFSSEGEIDPEALAAIEQLFRDKHTHRTHPVDPRLVKLLYRLAETFDAKQINVISGFRDERAGGSESRHVMGQAVDIVIPGVGLPALAKRARQLGFVGVGHYPNAGFVHIDTRERRSYFWVDPSGPGKPSCHRKVLTSLTFKFDAQWKQIRDEPKPHRDKRGRLLGETQRPPEPSPQRETASGPETTQLGAI